MFPTICGIVLLVSQSGLCATGQVAGPDNFVNGMLEQALLKAQRQHNLPDRIGTTILGQPEPAPGGPGRDNNFLGLDGAYGAFKKSRGLVTGIEYQINVHDPEYRDTILEILTRYFGKPLKSEDAELGTAWVWKEGRRTLRFISQDGGGMSQAYSLRLESQGVGRNKK